MQIRLPYRSNRNPFRIGGQPSLVNCYAEPSGDDNKSPYTIVPVPGMATLGSQLPGPCRGMIFLEDDQKLYSVNGFYLYEIEADGTKTQIGLVPGTGTVWLARNNATATQLLVVSENQVKKLESGSFTGLVYFDDMVPDGVISVGGYFIFWRADGRLYASDVLSTDVQPLNFATAFEASGDGLTFCYPLGKQVYVTGPKQTEIWTVNTGSGFPLTPLGSATIDIGSKAPRTVQTFDNGIMFVGSDNQVYAVKGFGSTPVATPEISRLIENEDHENLRAYTWQRGVNKFYGLQGTGWTREYNAATGSWHDRESSIDGQHRAIGHVSAFGETICGDRLTGDHYTLDNNLFTEAGDELHWGFVTETLHAFPNGLAFNALKMDCETGDGQSATSDGKIMLHWSDDGGRTWAGNRTMSLGVQGDYGRLVNAYGLGQCGPKGRAFRVRITDPVIRSVVQIDADAEPVPQ